MAESVNTNQTLAGKVALITGANGGLGMAVTQAFLDAGARVMGVARAISDADFKHPNFLAHAADVASADQAKVVVDAAVARWQRVDAWVHLVGGFAGGARVDEADDSVLARMMAVNVGTFLHFAKAVIPAMREQKAGIVLAIGSRAAVEPASGLGVYAASKAALVSLVRTLALENKDHGISANILLPGTMDTPANRAAMPSVDPASWVSPEQVAALLVHLASPQASQITGAVIPVYGREL